MSKSLVGRVTFVDNSVKAFGKSVAGPGSSGAASGFDRAHGGSLPSALTSTTTAEEFRLSIVKRLDLNVGDTFALFEVSEARVCCRPVAVLALFGRLLSFPFFCLL